MNSEFTPPSEAETTGSFIVTFREEASTEAIATLENRAGIRSADLLRSGDFAESGIDMDQVPAEGGAVLANLGMAVVNVPPDAAGMLAMEAGEDSAILSVEPEGVVYALSELRGGVTSITCAASGIAPRASTHRRPPSLQEARRMPT